MSDTDRSSSGGFEPVNVSKHALERWHERRQADTGVGPVVAWNEAQRLPQPHGLTCDEARYHDPTDLVLVVGTKQTANRTIVTAIRGEGAKPVLRSAIEEVSDR